ncbi:hypothetical protein C8R46DRAFT_1244485 [Mycena filopes]|nr:hypothetical protein C8R46DRAFT_1244485 [Mycena filopes]
MACGVNSASDFEQSSLLPDSHRIHELRDILRSNIVPPEISSFCRVAEEAPVELARYDAEIERLKESIDQLSSERATLAWYSDGCRSVASPVRRLPTELLAEIFDMCAPEGQDVISDTTTLTEEIERLAKKYLLQLAQVLSYLSHRLESLRLWSLHMLQVCSHWRSVAMGTSTLWSQIVVDTSVWSRIPHYSPTLLDLLASSLQRGGECPLTLQIAVDHGNRNERSVLNLLSEHSRRWRDVSMWIDPPSLSHLVKAKGNLSRLGFLRLASDTARGQSNHPGSDIFQIAPRLSDVRLAGWEDPVPVLPWGQLSFIMLGNGDTADLSAIQNLSHLPSDSQALVRITSNPLPIVFQPVCSNLHTLTVELMGKDHVTHSTLATLFQSLTLPQLDTFKLVREGVFSLWEQGSFRDFVSRSSLQTTLTVFQIDVVIEDNELLPVPCNSTYLPTYLPPMPLGFTLVGGVVHR